MHWIKARLNRDNFWNIMFWLGMTTGMAISQYISEYKGLFAFSICSTLIMVPLITKFTQSVKYDEEKGFFNCEGKALEDSLPKFLGLAIASSSVIIYFLLLIKVMPIIFYYSLFVLFITLYFLIINCPISIIFNKNAYKLMSTYELQNIRNAKHINSPSYSYMSCNVYNHHRHKRH